MIQKSLHKINSFSLLFKKTGLENPGSWETLQEMLYLVKKTE